MVADLDDEWQALKRRYVSEDAMRQLNAVPDRLVTAELAAGKHHQGSTPKPTG